MAFDINNKISQIKKDLERLEAELDSFNRANYDGSENSNIRKKQKQIKEKQLELLKYRNVKAMQQKDTMEILKLSGFTVDGDIILPQHEAKDASVHQYAEKLRREAGHFISHEQMAKELKKAGWSKKEAESEVLKEAVERVYGKDEEISPKFKKVMEEFGKGELKSSSGEKVTDPKQAKAIAYSEAKDDDATEEGAIKEYGKEKGSFEDGGPGSGIKGHTTSRSGYKMEDPKEIEAAIKKVKASGHANPYYLSGLERALQVAKEERGMKDDCGEKVFTKGTEDDDVTRWERRQDWLENQIRKLKSYGDRYSQQMLKGYKEEYDAITRKLSTMNKDAERSVVWVKPSEINYKIGDIIQFKGKNVKVTKITGNVVEAQVMDACSNKDSDPKVAEAEAMINLFGGVR